MDRATQESAASAEECASAAEELNTQAATLHGAVVELQRLVKGDVPETRPAARSEAECAGPALRKPERAPAHPGSVRLGAPKSEPVYAGADESFVNL